jgi:hypothetical protein
LAANRSPLVDPAEQLEREEPELRRSEIYNAWWRARAALIALPAPREIAPGILRYTMVVDVNQRLTGGEIEQIFALGIRAMHEKRGEIAEVVDGRKCRPRRDRN